MTMTDALVDLDLAVSLFSGKHSSHYQRGIAQFYLDYFESALDSFRDAERLGNRRCDLWIRKCKAELRRLGKQPDPIRDQIMETKSSASPSSSTSTASGTTSSADTSTATSTPSTITSSSTQCTPPSASSLVGLAQKVRLDWTQSLNKITVTLFGAKNVDPDKVQVHIMEQAGDIHVTLPDESKYDRKIAFFGLIKTDTLKIKTNKFKVEFSVEKASTLEWKTLEIDDSETKTEADIQARANIRRDDRVNPYASKKAVEEWDAVEKEVIEEEEKEQPEGQDGLHKLFQKIFKDASPEVRRAMVKSYQTSNGTVLSTNWDEVSKTDYEKDQVAPKGQEIRKWKDL